jgi:hypothetical protein
MLPKMVLILQELNTDIVIEWVHKMVDDDTIIFERVF